VDPESAIKHVQRHSFCQIAVAIIEALTTA
jgi:hypothetical protein